MALQIATRSLRALLLALALAFVCSPVWAQSRPHKSVLTVFWGAENYPTNPLEDAGIREALLAGNDGTIDYFAEYLESEHFPEEEASLALRDYIERKYRGRRIDLVIAATDAALQFVLRFRPELFPDAPIVYRGISSADAALRSAGPGLTGVWLMGGFVASLELALNLHPSTERVFVVAQLPTSRMRESLEEEFGAAAQVATAGNRIEITYLSDEPLPRLLAAIKAVPPGSVVLFVRYSQPEPGSVLIPAEAARLVAEASPVPVYGVSDTYIGTGVVGGSMYQTRAVGARMGAMARQILDGARAQDIPIEIAKPVPAFDWRQLKRWGISESQLPAGSTTLYRQSRPWELYQQQIIGAGLLLIFQTALIAGLLIQSARRRQTEGRNSAILRAMPDFMFLQTRDGVYVDYHAPDPGQLLFPPEQFLGKNMRDVLPPALVRAIEPAFAQAAVATEPVVVEYDLDLAQGTRWYEARLVRSNNQILTLVRDITEHKRAEAALRESAERYALATTAGAVGVWDWNFETNELYVDPRLKSLLGFEDAEISNRPEDWGSRVHPQDLPATTALVTACVQGGSDVYEVEHRMLHKDGRVKWVLSRGSTVRGVDGTLQRLVGTKVDITDRKRAEEEIRENEAVLRARNEEIHDLAGRLIASQEVERARIARDLHDDLSQQLASLAIALSAVKRQVGALAGAGELQGDVAALQQRTLALAENIRHLSHDLHPSVMEHAGLVAALANYCKELQRRHTVVVTFSAEGDLGSIGAEAAFCLYRVAQESLRNVVTHARARHVAVRLVRAGDDAELTIVDDGRGFDIEAAKSIKGLGLVSISERVRLAGGTVSIVTELNKGTSVRVQVPTHRTSSSGAASASASGPLATTV